MVDRGDNGAGGDEHYGLTQRRLVEDHSLLLPLRGDHDNLLAEDHSNLLFLPIYH